MRELAGWHHRECKCLECANLPPCRGGEVQCTGRPQAEVAIRTRSGFLVGFWDVVIPFRLRPSAWSFAEVGDRTSATCDLSSPINVALKIEVKAGRVDVATIARQIATYDHRGRAEPPEYFVVATCWPMPAADRATLAAKDVSHVWLASSFDEYVKSRESEDLGGDEF
jgi:hypothetical protein